MRGAPLVVEPLAGVVTEAAGEFAHGDEGSIGERTDDGGLLGGNFAGIQEDGAALVEQGGIRGLGATAIVLEGQSEAAGK